MTGRQCSFVTLRISGAATTVPDAPDHAVFLNPAKTRVGQ
jgi:hypothetical protein